MWGPSEGEGEGNLPPRGIHCQQTRKRVFSPSSLLPTHGGGRKEGRMSVRGLLPVSFPPTSASVREKRPKDVRIFPRREDVSYV